MNKELSSILRDKLASLPFVDVLAGMAQTLTTTDMDEANVVKITKRQPVSYDVIGVDTCFGREISLVPDSHRKSMIYFEDYGISVTGRIRGMTGYNSALRLIFWMNKANLVGNAYQEVSGPIMATIIDTLVGHNPENIGIFKRLTIAVTRIPPQDAALFSRYTYTEQDRQYLRPPFEFFGIDFACKYQVPEKCLSGINWNIENCI